MSNPDPKPAADDKPSNCQWAVVGPGRFVACPSTVNTLPKGTYTVNQTERGLRFKRKEIVTDELVVMENGLHHMVLSEIKIFWASAARYREYGMLHRRGFLLHGRQGCGKTCLVHIIAGMAGSEGAVVLMVHSPEVAGAALESARLVEPRLPIVLIMEDIDRLCEGNEESLTHLLDGQDSVDNVLVLATTNYLAKLPARIRNRPRRFDLVLDVPLPSEKERAAFLKANQSEDAP